MHISITIPGATPDEITKDLIATQEVFDSAGATPHQVAEAKFAVEGWDKGYRSLRSCRSSIPWNLERSSKRT
jgi:hypothetical protein